MLGRTANPSNTAAADAPGMAKSNSHTIHTMLLLHNLCTTYHHIIITLIIIPIS